MAGYTHTCASCEAALKIHDRYVGRALHCPHCGTEFLADPSLADVDDLLAEMAPEKPRGFPWRVLLVVVVFAAMVFVLGQSSHSGFLAEVFKPTRSPGHFAILAVEEGRQVPAAMDRETIAIVVGALEDPDPGSMQALKAQGTIIDVASGTKVKLLEHAKREKIARVRIIEGSWTGRVLWVPATALR